MMGKARLVLVTGSALLLLVAGRAHGRILDTPHNLSATGPGTVKAPDVGAACVFCHTPHRASQTRALWNRDLPSTSYQLYTSSTLEATGTLNQPTGASRLCLSCHDGTTALSAMRVPPAGGAVTLGPLTGRAVLGTDLSDDHPVSFVYDSALATRQGQLDDPAGLPAGIRLDQSGQLQCTSCHDPHENPYRKFLRIDDRGGALCLACHRQRDWTGSTHAVSTATWNGTGINPWPTTGYTNVADNACESCHRPHAASRPERLLSSAEDRGVCLACHDGSVTATNIEPQFAKPSAHPIVATDGIHQPREDPRSMSRHVTCVDCHDPHAVASTPATPPMASARLRGVRGVDISGGLVTSAVNEYEVCLTCHGLADQTTAPAIVRQDNTRNIRLEISPSNPSYHPLAAAGKNATIAGLIPPYTASSLIYCTDCHNDDQAAGGMGARGPHGSLYEPILERPYETSDPGSGTASGYMLCLKCHSESSLFQTRFPHAKHVVEARASCAVCHDAHGARQNIRLINFMRRSPSGNVVVAPSTSGRLEFIPDAEPGRGSCFLNCHGAEHDPRSY